MKNVFVIHGYNGDTSETFGPYLKSECEIRKITCFLPIFPVKQEATFEKWVRVMDEFLEKGLIHEQTIVIAHSLGTQFWVKYAFLRNLRYSNIY